MRVNHRGRHVGMAQQFLHRADIGTGLQKMRGKSFKGFSDKWYRKSMAQRT